jgi:hypothetical protein
MKVGSAVMSKTICTVKMIRFFGDSLMLGIFLLMVWLFVSAYFNENFTCTVNINKFGEAQVELILLIFILFPLFLITAVFSFLDWHRTINSRVEIDFTDDFLSYYTEPYYPGEDVICPACYGVFFVRDPNCSRVCCPICGTVGKYQSKDDYLEY